jgi:hypothetical protein
MAEDKTVIGQLRKLAELEGFEDGTEVFDRRIRQLKVIKCRELKGVSTCGECPVFDFCELAKQVLREHRGFKDEG